MFKRWFLLPFPASPSHFESIFWQCMHEMSIIPVSYDDDYKLQLWRRKEGKI